MDERRAVARVALERGALLGDAHGLGEGGLGLERSGRGSRTPPPSSRAAPPGSSASRAGPRALRARARARQVLLHADGDGQVVGDHAVDVELGGARVGRGEERLVALEGGLELARRDLEPGALDGAQRRRVHRR